MRNEYTDYIAHGHKYFAVVDLGKKNSKGTKLRRYFYSANEYKNYLAGKKTLDDKLLGGVSKAYNKVKGLSTVAKTLPKLAKAAKETSKMTEGERTDKNVETRARRAGLKIDNIHSTQSLASNSDNQYNTAKDTKGNSYLISRKDRKIYSHDGKEYGNSTKVMDDANKGKGKDVSKELIKKNPARAASKIKMPEISNNNSPYGKAGKAISKAIDKTVGAKVRENFVERMVEKGINKANAEAMRKKLEDTYQRATKISTSANNLKNRLDNLQEAFTSGDGDKALDAIDETLKDQEAIQKDIFTIVDEMMPEAKKVADTFLDMGKKTLDTATAGPKAIVGDKDVKTFEDSSTTWDDASMKKIEDAVNKAFEEKNKKRKK